MFNSKLSSLFLTSHDGLFKGLHSKILAHSLRLGVITVFDFLCFQKPASSRAEEHSESASLGLQLAQVSIKSSGYINGTINATPAYITDVVVGLSRRSAFSLQAATGSNVYMNLALNLRYFPFSFASRKINQNHAFALVSDDFFKPYLLFGLSIGRVRLETEDEIAATEISANFYGYDLGIGTSLQLSSSWQLQISANYGQLMARSDSTVAFKGSRVQLAFGPAVYL